MVSNEILDQAEAIIGHTFRRRELLAQALTHASISDSRIESNERLEFLGDAVLGLIVCDYLHSEYPDLLEGDLTKIKSVAVSRQMCSRVTKDLGLDRLLALGKGMKSRNALPSSLSAAVLEAVIGALYLDAGLEAVNHFLMSRLVEHIERAARSGHQQNFKSVLQQYAQRTLSEQPVYLLLDEKGPDHAKCFHVCVEIGSQRFDAVWAPSKKQGEQQAAFLALESLGLITRDEHGHAIYSPSGEDEISRTSDPELFDDDAMEATAAPANDADAA